MAQKINGLSRDFIIHPGETIAEVMEEKNMSQKELAIRCGYSEKHISTVISGQKNISPDFAKKLEYALGIDAIFWINLQTNYDKELLEFEELNNITKEEISILSKFKDIFKEYKKHGFLDIDLSDVDEVIEARKVFNVSNLLQIPKLTHTGAYRINKSNNIDDYVLYAWERLCELIDENNEQSEDIVFNMGLLKKSISDIKNIMFLDTDYIIPELHKVFAKCGISFYLMKSFSGAPVQGYIRKNSRNGLSLYMTIRGSYADIFWFSLFHEIAHIINGDIKNIYIDYNDTQDTIENRANECAANFLISKESYAKFVLENKYDLNSIFSLAKENNVKPYICLGRLMKDNHISWSKYNQYRERYKLLEA